MGRSWPGAPWGSIKWDGEFCVGREGREGGREVCGLVQFGVVVLVLGVAEAKDGKGFDG